MQQPLETSAFVLPVDIRERVAANVLDGPSLRSLSLAARSWRSPALAARYHSLHYTLKLSGRTVALLIEFFQENGHLAKAVRDLSLEGGARIEGDEYEVLDIHKCMLLVAAFPGLQSLALTLIAWTAPVSDRPAVSSHATLRHLYLDVVWRIADTDPVTADEWWLTAFRSLADCVSLEYVRIDIPIDLRTTATRAGTSVSKGTQLECLYSLVRFLPSSVKALDLFFEVANGTTVGGAEKLSLRIDWHLLGLYVRNKPSLAGVVLHVDDSALGSGVQYTKAETRLKDAFSTAGLRSSDPCLTTE
ncbi:hypothetical protein EIP86_001106 [Pleurotus ostreatoroseus]|nr:hypothetical protein EIP86_001106 [Pleurotus ostreatoroseus]